MGRGSIVTISADNTILASNKPIRIYGVAVKSGASDGVLSIRNGRTVSSPIVLTVTGTANLKVLSPRFPKKGLFFPGGVFMDLDANVTEITVFAEEEYTI